MSTTRHPSFIDHVSTVSDIWFDSLTLLGLADALSDDDIEMLSMYMLAITAILSQAKPLKGQRFDP
jgi:hypothetical protein